MKESWNETPAVRSDLPPEKVARLLEERNDLMEKVREIDEQMSAIMAMCEKWQEITRIMR